MARVNTNWYNYMRSQAKEARLRGDMTANHMWWQQIHARAAARRHLDRSWGWR
jgi:hypothetical protein